ncbi:MAG: MerR family transcriptional regulator [Endomicrobium sp.]|uniref:MerR family transcriptional regulator n=1 Tax=Candidatus Endomicrobiellum pyrsonymphae TaxID=1408203 RepID=UPI003582C9A8|nr:MerR family transcriptional regulator [Endomicrobium sp.]MCA6073027.1 MerR family transcriptional regulator [Endomicrobium sp.]
MSKIPPIPDKEYFTIGELSQITLVPKHTLRYWESEFKLLRPVRKSTGHKKYRKEDVEIVFKIKDLLYNQRYTIEGVKKCLMRDKRKKSIGSSADAYLTHMPDSEFLINIKDELKHLLKLFKK